MEEWYYAINGVQQGPVSREALMQMLANGQVAGESLVWREGMGDWLPASRVPELANIARPAPAASPQYPGSPQMLGYGVGDSIYQAGAGVLPYAGFWIRLGAAFIDGLIVGGTQTIVGLCLIAVASANGAGQDVTQAINGGVNFIGLIAGWLYFASMTSSAKQASLGMMAVGIRVTDMNGARISFGKATGRHFAAILSGCLCGAGYIMIAFTEKKQGLHDQMAGTLVLRN